jgi:hypothetical protein
MKRNISTGDYIYSKMYTGDYDENIHVLQGRIIKVDNDTTLFVDLENLGPVHLWRGICSKDRVEILKMISKKLKTNNFNINGNI